MLKNRLNALQQQDTNIKYATNNQKSNELNK